MQALVELVDATLVVEVRTTPAFAAGKPRRLFEGPYTPSSSLWSNYDVTADGQRFLLPYQEQETGGPVTVVLNWTSGLKP